MKTTATHQNTASAGNGATPDCNKIVSLLDMIIDGEASDDDKTYFFSHLDSCKECFGAHQKQNQLKQLVRDNIKRKLVPANLTSFIKTVILATA
jgi:anti-sigma factor (TIGR02949 family)